MSRLNSVYCVIRASLDVNRGHDQAEQYSYVPDGAVLWKIMAVKDLNPRVGLGGNP